jgi:hypothetical protein
MGHISFWFTLKILLGDNIDTIKKNMETLIDASKEVGLETNVEKTKYRLLSRHQNVGQNQNWETETNQNLIQEEIKRRLNSGKCLLPFAPEPSVFSSAIEKHKN